MRQYSLFSLFLFILLSFSFLKKQTFVTNTTDSWPKPLHDYTKVSNYEAKFQIGRALFYDPLLSSDSTISCASCHLSFTGFAHVDHSLSHGINGQIGHRNAPALINLAWSPFFHWDGMFTSLENQSVSPIENPKEMNMPIAKLIQKLNSSNKYRGLFYKSFGEFHEYKPKANDQKLYNIHEKQDIISDAHPQTAYVADAMGKGGLVENGHEQSKAMQSEEEFDARHRNAKEN